MNEYPHQISLRCDSPKRLAQRLLLDLPLSGIELDQEQGLLSIRTADPRAFYAGLPALAVELDLRIHEVVSQDDNLEAVFKYLVGS
jgi:ABC-2 type transport system ATP-binding protein